MQRRSVWYHFGRRTLHPTGECTFPRDTQCDRDQRGGPNQISFGEHYYHRDGGGLAEYHSVERFCSYCEHGLFHGDGDRHNEYGRGVEFEWSGLQRLLLWVTRNEFTGGCLYGASSGALTAERYDSGDQHGGTEQDGFGKCNHCVRCCSHGDTR